MLDAVARELVSVGSGKDVVTVKLGRNDLDDNVTVCEADYQAVLGAVVLVLCLGNKCTAGLVVCLALCSMTTRAHQPSVRRVGKRCHCVEPLPEGDGGKIR